MTAASVQDTRPNPWSKQELWPGAALLGGIGFAFLFVMLAAGGALTWSQTAGDTANVFFTILRLLIAWLLFMVGRGIRWKDVGFRPFRLRHSVLIPMLLVAELVFLITFFGFLETLGSLPGGGSETEKTASARALGVVGSAVAAPSCEELFCRGILFAGFRCYYGARKAAVLSALVFGASHLNPIVFPIHFVGGVALAALFDATGSLWPSILYHAAWNGLIELGNIGWAAVLLLLGLSAVVVVLSPPWFGAAWLRKRIRERRGVPLS